MTLTKNKLLLMSDIRLLKFEDEVEIDAIGPHHIEDCRYETFLATGEIHERGIFSYIIRLHVQVDMKIMHLIIVVVLSQN